jgi:hypothetical protein
MFKLIYLGLSRHLQAILGPDAKPLLKAVDWYAQQYQRTKEAEMVNEPAAYIEFMGATLEDMGQKYQMATIILRVHLVTRATSNGKERFATTAFTHEDVASAVYRALNQHTLNLKSLIEFAANPQDFTLYNPLTRTRLSKPQQYPYMVTIQEFRFTAVDNSAILATQRVLLGIDLTVEVDRP